MDKANYLLSVGGQVNLKNGGTDDSNDSFNYRKRSRGSTTDDKMLKAQNKLNKLKYDSSRYSAQKKKVIDARKPKFGIFKRSSNNDPYRTTIRDSTMLNTREQSEISSANYGRDD